MNCVRVLQGETTPKASPGVGAVSSTMDVDESPLHCHGGSRKPRIRREPATTTSGAACDDHRSRMCDGLKEDAADFYETNCHWTGCGLEFGTQDELVKVRLEFVSRVLQYRKC